MFILFNGEILSNVSRVSNRDKSTYLECLGWQYHNSSVTKDSKRKKYPCIIFPDFSQDYLWEKCLIGYIDFKSMEFSASKIVLDNIIVKQIEVCRKTGTGGPKTRDGWIMGIDYSEYFYKIEISLYYNDYHGKKTAYQPSVFFQSYDIIWDEYYEIEQAKYSKTIHYLFVDFPKLIKNYLYGNEIDHYFCERPLCLLNYDILQKEWPNKEMYDYPVSSCTTAKHEYLFDRNDKLDLPFSFDKAISTLLTIKVERNDDGIIVKIGNGDLLYLNIYFEKIFEFAFNQKLLYNSKEKIAYCQLNDDIPFKLTCNNDIAAYIACTMHLYLYKYFDLEASRQLYMVSIPHEIVEYEDISLYISTMDPIDIEEYFFNIYRFLFCCKIEHKQVGNNRVGRDDYETKHKYYEFYPRKGYRVSDSVINKINILLQTKLAYEDEDTGWLGHPERFSYCNVYSREFFGGEAKSQDLGSLELRNASFLYVSNYFVMEYLTDKEDFKRFLK